MIYFDLPTVARIATGLVDALAPEGWLILGASDPPLANLVSCESVMTPFGVAYRRPRRQAAETPLHRSQHTEPLRKEWNDVEVEPAPHRSSPVTEVGAVARAIPAESADRILRAHHAVPDDGILLAYESADYQTAESLLAIALASKGGQESGVWLWILYIRTVANQGRLHDAGEICARALEVHPLVPELHYLHATLLSQANWHVDAAIAARRSIYLDRKFVMGHLQLGEALTRSGDSKGARLSFENAAKLLEDVDPTESITGADGIAASRLRQIATLRLRELNSPLR